MCVESYEPHPLSHITPIFYDRMKCTENSVWRASASGKG